MFTIPLSLTEFLAPCLGNGMVVDRPGGLGGDDDWWSGGWGNNAAWDQGRWDQGSWRDQGWWEDARASGGGSRGSARPAEVDHVRGGTRADHVHGGTRADYVRGGTRADAASGAPAAKEEPDDEYVCAVLQFSLKEDFPPNTYSGVVEEIKNMGCTISLRSKTSKRATEKTRQARVTIKGQLAQDACALFCQRAESLIERKIDWRSVPFRQRWRDKEQKDAATQYHGSEAAPKRARITSSGPF